MKSYQKNFARPITVDEPPQPGPADRLYHLTRIVQDWARRLVITQDQEPRAMYGSPPRFDKGSRNPRSLTFNAARQTATFWAMAQPIRSRRRYARQPQAAVKGFSRAPRSVTPIHFSSQGARQRYTFQSFQRRPGMLCNFIIPPG